MKSVNNINTDCKSTWTKISGSAWLNRFTAIVIVTVIVLPGLVMADMREERPVWTMGFEGFFSKIEGRMGFDQQNAGYGTLNDLREDLGLPWDNISYRVVASIRPLQHHLLRMYGSIPELYYGQAYLTRELRTTRYPASAVAGGTVSNDRSIVYSPGSSITSQMRTATFGLGYDLDFLLWPNWVGGFNGDLRYIDLKIKMMGNGQVIPVADDPRPQNNTLDVISLDELVPCLGGHSEVVFPINFGCGPGSSAGAFGRLVYGITPNYLNYVDVTTGVTLNLVPSSRFSLNTRFGYEHESIFHDAQNRNGRVMELKRDGIMFRGEGLF